ncbi:thioredoxin family protein [Isoptericola sp. b408]|uniref:thioredoxin family protein n=1 Tax=Isoptericola sp. b408 TaxID=3064653 RepID=UPI002712C4E0|nr:thioredoxin family protein [Isoptericola sp. b408]MDO8152182.1 thioredoxin family protein [Isoptericola sp. b408]
MTAQWTALAALLVVTAVLALTWRSAQGRVRTTAPGAVDAAATGWTDELVAQGVTPGDRATFLQLSAEVCSACRSTARTLGALAAEEPGVTHVEVDVDHRPDLVERAGVRRTPTVLVLDAAGTEVARASGGMTPARARDALATVPSAPVAGRTA